MRNGRSLARAALAVLLLLVSPALSKADDRPLSQAQIDLLESDHLKSIVKSAVLEYSFVRRSGVAGDFTDTVTAEIRAVHDDGRKDVWVQFLTGDRALSFGPARGSTAIRC